MDKDIKEVDINEYMPVLIELINKGNTVPLLISGNSMSPFLVHHRDTILISKLNKKLTKGDIVFFRRNNGKYVVHRIHHINDEGQLYIVGDGQTVIEGPIDQKQVFGIINEVIRKNKNINCKSFLWKFFSILWIRMINIRSILIRLYNFVKV